MRLDKFLKVSRVIKRRTVANEACDLGRVKVNDKISKAFTEVTISNFGIWWSDEGVCMDLHFNYIHNSGGSNGAEFCRIDIVNDFVKIRQDVILL